MRSYGQRDLQATNPAKPGHDHKAFRASRVLTTGHPTQHEDDMLTDYEIGEAWDECSRLTLSPEKKAIAFARDIERAALRAQADAQPVATVRVTHKGYGMELSTYVAYALSEGKHDLYTHPAAEAAQVGLSGGWKQAAEWVRDNYQDYPNVASLVDAILTRAPAATVAEPSAGAAESWKKNAEGIAVQKQSLQDAILKAGRDYVRSFLMADEIKAFDEAMATADMRHGQAAQQQANQGTSHEWDASGERCLKCGDKDWFAGSTCSGKTAQQAEPSGDEREEAGSLLGDGFVLEFERWNDVTGALPRNGSWLAEVSDIIQRAAQSGQRTTADEYARGLREGIKRGHGQGMEDGMRIQSDRQKSQRAGEEFQARVQPWMMACFGPEIAADAQERNHRFLEEALELVQACGATASEAYQLVDYVYGRPAGDKHQEIGGVMVTLAALCLAQGQDMHAAGETELARIWTKVEQIRAKQAAKPKHSPLPEHTVGQRAGVAGTYSPCLGMNCGCTDGVNHSPECHAETAATYAGGYFVKAASQITDALIEHEAGLYGYYKGDVGDWVFEEYKLLEFARSIRDRAAAPTQQQEGGK
ncbi:hypothetical protein [Ralstonia syzygii]|uniref:hypothetical protein n=1 Tax=Ralstonia syzygii TaxID=28097 RepID=UPI003518C3A8